MTLDFLSKVQNLALIFGIDLAQPRMITFAESAHGDEKLNTCDIIISVLLKYIFLIAFLLFVYL